MFENLRNAFREAVENFNKELSRDQVPETVDKLLKRINSFWPDGMARGDLEPSALILKGIAGIGWAGYPLTFSIGSGLTVSGYPLPFSKV